MKTPDLLKIAVLGVALTAANAEAAPAFTGMYVFGDSLNDAGNFAAFGFPGLPYSNFHFSNGPTWTEDLAVSLGLSLTPSEAGGTDFAWGGATTGAPSSQTGPLPPLDLPTQAGQYLARVGGVADPSGLFVVAGGGNDFFAGNVSQVATNLSFVITTLASAGAKHFLVPNLPDFSLTPAFPGSAVAQGAAQLVNAALVPELQNLRTALGVNIVAPDNYSFLNQIVAHPGDFGLSNVTDACLGAIICADPDSFLFWDSVHPTAHGHRIFAEQALQVLNAASVPLPTSIWLFLPALGILAGKLGRRIAA